MMKRRLQNGRVLRAVVFLLVFSMLFVGCKDRDGNEVLEETTSVTEMESEEETTEAVPEETVSEEETTEEMTSFEERVSEAESTEMETETARESTEAVTEPVTIEETEADTQSVREPIAEESSGMDIGNGLKIMRTGGYAGIYMEDGSDEIVSGIMMIILKNEAKNDLQYAEIRLQYESDAAEFKVTNLPAGESVVLLEQNRKAATAEILSGVTIDTMVFFSEPVKLYEDVLKISGVDGALNVKNISDKDISGDIYVYYKNSAQDIFYGGITYRARVEGGLAAGEIKQVTTGHYSPKTCRILMVTGVE